MAVFTHFYGGDSQCCGFPKFQGNLENQWQTIKTSKDPSQKFKMVKNRKKNVVFNGDSNLLAVLLKVIEDTQIVFHS